MAKGKLTAIDGEKASQVNPERELENPNMFLRLITHHYRNQTVSKSHEQLEREKWLLPGILPFSRWALIPAAVVMQLCVGSLYAWSVFNKPVDMYIYGEIRNMAPTTFYVACGLLGSSAAVLGPWLERKGPLFSSYAGIAIFSSGHLVTALGIYIKQMWMVYVGYGVLGGIGTGLCYISPVSALQKWFPDRRGMASGFAVCGFGAGSIAVAKVAIPLIQSVGLPLTFVVLGGCYFVVMSVAAVALRTPPPDFEVNGMRSDGSLVANSNDCNNSQLSMDDEATGNRTMSDGNLTLIESLSSTDFRLIFIVLMSDVLFGICCYSRLSNMVTDLFNRSPDEAATIVALNGCFNLGGRLLFALISDYWGRKSSYIIMLTTQLVLVACFSTITSTKAYWTFVVSMWALTLCYGGGYGTVPALLTDRFGPHNTGACHGVTLVAWSITAVVGGFVYTAVFNLAISSGYTAHHPYPYNVNSWWILAFICIGWVCLMFMSPTEKDVQFRTKTREVCKKIVSCKGKGSGRGDKTQQTFDI